MKALLVGESRKGKLLSATDEALAFAQRLNVETVHFLVGSRSTLPAVSGRLYFADSQAYGEYDPDMHKDLLLEVVRLEQPDLIVFAHSSYGWDLAPRLAVALRAGQISEVVDFQDGAYVVPACNSKLRRRVKPASAVTIITLQSGAFSLPGNHSAANPTVVEMTVAAKKRIEFLGYEVTEKGGVDLTRAEVIVSAGRGVGKPENLAIIEALAKALKGEMGASRPVVDAGWVEHNRQVGSTGQTVSPKLYVACGISGAIQHLIGMKKSEFVVAINTDRDAPIGEVADVLIVADLKEFIPRLTEKLRGCQQ